MSRRDPNLQVAILNTAIALLQLVVGIVVIPQVQRLLEPSAPLVFSGPVPARPELASLDILTEDIVWVVLFSMGYAAAWIVILGVSLVGVILITPLPEDVNLRKIAPIVLYFLWVAGAILGIFLRTQGAPPLSFVIFSVEAQIVGILIGIGVSVALAIIAAILMFAGSCGSSVVYFAIIALAVLAPLIGSVIGAWYGVYG